MGRSRYLPIRREENCCCPERAGVCVEGSERDRKRGISAAGTWEEGPF